MIDADEVKACCAAGYSSDLVALLLGESYHPGGLRLTRHLLDLLEVAPGLRLGDVASGTGASALLAASEYGADVEGVDYSATNVERGVRTAADRGLGDRVRFTCGDAEALPVADASWDRVICECALCTFPDKVAAAREIDRVLSPGGRVGITDVTADPARLSPELTTLSAWVACIADARPGEHYAALLADAGLVVETVEDQPQALARMLDMVEGRLELARMTTPQLLASAGVDRSSATATLAAARRAVADGVLGYTLITARKPI